jgi:hypothetical protein
VNGALVVCLGGSSTQLLLALLSVLGWFALHMQEARWREEDARIERAHLIGRCMRLEAERNLLLKRNRQLLGIETELPS